MNWSKNPQAIRIIKNALAEDIGKGDVTSKLLLAKNSKTEAVIYAVDAGIICGIDIAALCFKLLDKSVQFKSLVTDGQRVKRGRALAKICGKTLPILSAERTALNFLGTLSAVATHASAFTRKISRYKTRILDTRKTIPGLRQLQKYAVRVGGGYNHRFGLDDMILIKENHLAASCVAKRAACVESVVHDTKKLKPENIKVEIEVKNLNEFKSALKACPDVIMLDNMKPANVRKAVLARDKTQKNKGVRKIMLEASGNITLNNIVSYAQTGVDFISLGTLTKDIQCFDLSLQIK